MGVQWNDDLLTGNTKVDEQHKKIFNTISELFDACKNGTGREVSITTFSFLENYIIKHFEAEELIMQKYNYPYFLSHIAEHQQFKSVVSELKQELEVYGTTGLFVINLNNKLVQWLISHICKEDKALAKHIQERI